METSFTGLDFPFTLENVKFHAHNLSLDTFSIPMPGHRHGSGCYEIHYVTEGYGTVQLEGEVCRIEPNTLYVTGPQVYHEQIPDKKNPMKEYCIYIQLDMAGRSGKNAGGGFLKKFLDTRQWFGQDTQDLRWVFEKIFLELNRQYIGYGAEVTSLLQQLVIRVIRNYQHKREEEGQFSRVTPADGMYLITEKCFLFEYADITLEELAKRLGISTRQTERFLKKEYGETFQQKKTHARMAAAASFLMNPAWSITAIAEKLGYSSVEHFSHAFRKYYGVSARAYRNRLSEEQDAVREKK